MIWLDWLLQSLGFIGSVAGIILNAKKKIICWWVWNAANIFWIWLNVRFKLWIVVMTMIIYCILNTFGYLKWRKECQK